MAETRVPGSKGTVIEIELMAADGSTGGPRHRSAGSTWSVLIRCLAVTLRSPDYTITFLSIV